MKDFNQLISSIEELHSQTQASAANAVNQVLTIRNWLIGYYIVEYEQNGKDRAEYGDRLVDNLADKLNHIKGIDRRSLFKFRQFYLIYPQIAEAIQQMSSQLLENNEKVGAANPLLNNPIVGAATPQSETGLKVPAELVLSKLSYTHIEQLLVGILLVAEKDHALVEYATAGMDENLFVKQYMLQLPSTDQLKNYIEKELKELR